MKRTYLWIGIGVVCVSTGLYSLFIAVSPSLSIPVITGRAEDETSIRLEQKPGTYGDRLFIPQINVDVAIVNGDDESALEKGAWHRHPENGDPISGGNFVLSAHRFVMSMTPQGTAIKSPFYNIDKLNSGDRLSVDYQSKRYEYEITRKYVVKPTDTAIEARSAEPKMTLYSCTLGGEQDGRDVIEAKLVKG